MIETMYKVYKIDSTKSIDAQMIRIIDDFGTPGVSPGYAAGFLGVSRQAIDHAIRNGSLRACKLYEKGKHVSTLIDTASLDAYKELRHLNGGKLPYRAIALA
jgi:hypothetical protein